MTANTIDEVLSQLDDIIDYCRETESRLGFLAALYRKVTVQVKVGIEAGRFDDGPRMERFDVLFANRYLDAFERHRRGDQPSRCWQVAFQAADSWRLIIVQHLLLGINAHINLDLGVAAGQTSPGQQLPDLKGDFDQINTILSALLDEVQDELGTLSPWMRLVDRVGGRTDEAILNFSLGRARKAAWRVAETIAPASPEQALLEIEKIDDKITKLARLVQNPGLLIRASLFVVRLAERRTVPEVIDTLR